MTTLHSHSIIHPHPLTATPDLESVVCDFCGRDDAEVLGRLPAPDAQPFPMHRLGAQALQLGGQTIQFSRCRTCGLVYMNPRLTDDAIARFYDRIYGTAGAEERFESSQSAFTEYVIQMCAGMLGSPSQTRADVPAIFDIGCGGGQLLHTAQRRGWRVGGSEVSRVAAERAMSLLGVPIHYGDFRAAALTPASYDVVTLVFVVEHVRAPVNYLRDAAALLKPGGVLCFCVPSPASWEFAFARLTGQLWRGFIIEHLYYFTPAFIERLLAGLGLAPLRLSAWSPDARYPNPLRDVGALLKPHRSGASAVSDAPAIPPLPPVSLPRRAARQVNNYLLDIISTASIGGRDGTRLNGNALYVWARKPDEN
jgi:SAM-dependent methyltransferase